VKVGALVAEHQASDPGRARQTSLPTGKNAGNFSHFGRFGQEPFRKAQRFETVPGIIPYAGEQGIFSAYQGIKVPCSAEHRDISRLMRRLLGAFRAQARRAEKIGVQSEVVRRLARSNSMRERGE
jgi:hypothetical protein